MVFGGEDVVGGWAPGDDETEGYADGKKGAVEGHYRASLVEKEDIGDGYGCWRAG